MNTEVKPKKLFKEKFFRELIDYWINVAYLAVFFAVFISYKRLILAEHNIIYTNYGVGVIKALVLGKVVSIGTMIRIGKGLENWPLLYSTINRSLLFTIWLALFNALELSVKGFFRSYSLEGVIEEISYIGSYEYFGNALVVFVSFIPFFAFKEISRVLGTKTIMNLFLKGPAAMNKESAG